MATNILPTNFPNLPFAAKLNFIMSARIAIGQTAKVCGASASVALPRFVAASRLYRSTSTLPLRSRRALVAPRMAAAASAPEGGDVKGDMLEPSVANNPVVRAVSLAATVAAAAYSTAFFPAAAIGFIHVMVFGTWFGTLAWTSFIFGIVAFRNLPRQTFGKLQSKLFPKYFTVSAVAPALLLVTLRILTGGEPPVKEVVLLGISLGASLLNLFFTEPAATRVMFKRYELENALGERDDAAIKALAKQFGKWHGISSLLNLAVLVCAVGHAYYLGARLAF